jgi:hypothetical protein
MINVKESGNLTLSQQAKLIGEIDTVAKLEDDELAAADAEEIRSFIDMLHAFGFIGSDKKSRYLLGLDMAMKRSKRYDAD